MDSAWQSSEWFHSAWLQAGLTPFLAALVFAGASRQLLPRVSRLTLMVGFLAGAGLAGSLVLWPQGVVDKIVAVGVGALIVGILADWLHIKPGYLLAGLWVPVFAAILWLLWPVLLRKDIVDSAILVVGLTVATLVATGSVATLADAERPGHVYGAVLIMAGSAALACVFRGQNLLTHLVGGLAAAAGGALMIIAIAWLPAFKTAAGMAIPAIDSPVQAGQSAALPGTLMGALVLVSALIYGNLPWISVLLLLLMPVVMLFSPTSRKQFGLTVLLGGVVPVALAVASVYFAFRGFSPLSLPSP